MCRPGARPAFAELTSTSSSPSRPASLHSPLFLSLLFFSSSFRVTTTSTLNYASILIWLGLQTPPILFSRGEGTTVLLCHVRESIKMDARRFLAMAMSAARGMRQKKRERDKDNKGGREIYIYSIPSHDDVTKGDPRYIRATGRRHEL